MRLSLICLMFLASCSVSETKETNWPGFRGIGLQCHPGSIDAILLVTERFNSAQDVSASELAPVENAVKRIEDCRVDSIISAREFDANTVLALGVRNKGTEHESKWLFILDRMEEYKLLCYYNMGVR